MFSNRIANSANFLQMPAETQLLFFHMVLRADDDGVVESYPIMKLLGTAPDNFKVLLAKGFIKQLNEDQVIVIVDWREHNKIRPDRKVDSLYLPVLQHTYPEIKIVVAKPRSDVEDNSRRVDGPRTAEVKLSQGNKTSVAIAPRRVEIVTKDPDQNPKKASRALYPHSEEIFDLFTPRDVSWKINTTQQKHAEQLYGRGIEKVKQALKFYERHKDEEHCPQVFTPHLLNTKWQNLQVYANKL
jgi:hypothetical protein